jgi:hypothetical protein
MSGFAPVNPGDPLMGDEEKITLVLKKALGVPNTKPADPASLFSEIATPSRSAVFTSQIYSQLVPTDADVSGGSLTSAAFGLTQDMSFVSGDGAGLAARYTSATWPQIAYYAAIPLAPAFPGNNQAFASPLLAGAVPGTLSNAYLPVVTDVTGSGLIPVGANPYIIDGDAGILTFYANVTAPGVVPVTSAAPPRVSFFRYEGTRGLGADLWTLNAGDGSIYYDAGAVAIGKAEPDAGYALDVSGSIQAYSLRATRMATLSDRRLKTDVTGTTPGAVTLA